MQCSLSRAGDPQTNTIKKRDRSRRVTLEAVFAVWRQCVVVGSRGCCRMLGLEAGQRRAPHGGKACSAHERAPPPCGRTGTKAGAGSRNSS
jgi:hypothetical protein